MTPDSRIEQLSAVSARRVIDPDVTLPGRLGDGQVLPDALLSVAGLDLDLSPEQRARLSREELASITQAGVHFEAVLTAGFALMIARARELRAPSVTYLLHEIGEESRHSRLFVRMLHQLAPEAQNPFARGLLGFLADCGVRAMVGFPSLLYVLVLGGEEIPDLLQKLAAEHPDTDPFLREINQYHRQEEARHVSFARTMLPAVWRRASPVDRLAVRFVAPRVIRGMFDLLVHPGVYAAVGLPGWATWWSVRRSPQRIELRHRATRPVLNALLAAGAVGGGDVPRAWRALCGVDADGTAINE
ncbi:MAG: diiron oxygenase [Actinomycetota bacterium]|nr:diiron oxygenase [Actinomycetota bacterium]